MTTKEEGASLAAIAAHYDVSDDFFSVMA